MWYGKNNGKWDDEGCPCHTQTKQLTVEELKAKLEALKLRDQLEQYFFNVLEKEE